MATLTADQRFLANQIARYDALNALHADLDLTPDPVGLTLLEAISPDMYHTLTDHFRYGRWGHPETVELEAVVEELVKVYVSTWNETLCR